MNKTLIALAVSAAAVATGANAAEIYNQDGTTLELGGRAEARLSLQDGEANDKTRVRLNFLGKTQVTDNLYGVGFYEGEFTTDEQGDVDNNNDLNTRQAWAGLGGEFGEIGYGKIEGALGVITDFTDIMAYHGNSAADKLAVADRTDNMIAYKGQFSDLGLKASYRFADQDTSSGSFDNNDEDGYSLSAIYALGDTGLKLGGGYADQNDSNEYMLGVSYAIGDLYVAGLFTDGEKNFDGNQFSSTNFTGTQDYTGYEFAAAYTIGKTVLSTTYNNAETDSDTSTDNVAIDATYYFKPNFRGYVSYNFNLLDEDDNLGTGTVGEIAAEDELALGLRYDF